jgi:hypothetical protein
MNSKCRLMLHCNGLKRSQTLEVVSKPRVKSKGKASGRSGKRSIREYVSIYRRLATQPLGFRWGFETTSTEFYEKQYRIDLIYFCLFFPDIGLRLRRIPAEAGSGRKLPTAYIRETERYKT